MKKFYAFFAAALMSVSVFAAKDVVPTDAVLADYYNEGQLCVCIYVPDSLSCNDFVFVGTYNDWSAKAADCKKFVPVENYDGWYVVAIDDDGLKPDETPYDDIEGKPVLLDANNAFSWEYQAGEVNVIRGTVDVVAGNPGEIDLKNYDKSTPVVYTVEYLKAHNNPCTAVYHNYTIAVINDGCDGWAVPFIVGAMNGWQFEEMQLDEAKSEGNLGYYFYKFKGAEGTPFQVVSGLRQNEEPYDIEVVPGWNDDSYLQIYVDGAWKRIPGEQGDNRLTHENPEIVFDLREDTARWARCAPAEPDEYIVLKINFPKENAPEAIEIIGTFDDWAGTAMEKLENGWYFVELEAKASQFFKFRTAGLWPNEGGQELEIYRPDDEWTTIKDNELVFGQLWQDYSYKGTPCKTIEGGEWDLSDPNMYRWSEKEEQGIENVVLTEKAKKVVVDGVLYIVRDNKLFNIQGAQLR